MSSGATGRVGPAAVRLWDDWRMESIKNFVNGRAVDARDGRTTEIVDPTTGTAYATAPLSGDADVDDAMRAAAAAFDGWRATTPSERSLALLRIADAIESRAEELIRVEVRNTGSHLEAEQLARVFDRFYRGADTGTGGSVASHAVAAGHKRIGAVIDVEQGALCPFKQEVLAARMGFVELT